MRRVDDHLIVGVGLEQRLVTFGELCRVLAHAGRGDGEQRLVARVRIGVVLAVLVVGKARIRSGLQSAGPRRDAAVRVTGLLPAERGEVLTQPRGLLGAHGAKATDANSTPAAADRSSIFIVPPPLRVSGATASQASK